MDSTSRRDIVTRAAASSRPRARVAELVAGLRDFILPAACAVCREALGASADGLVCRTCWTRVVSLVEPTCARCGHPRLSPNLPGPMLSAPGEPDSGPRDEPLPSCRWCARLPPYVRSVRSVCRVDVGTGGAIVHALKYDGWPAVASAMARRMARLQFPADVVAERSALMPIPLSRTRRRQRGYNQAEELARALADVWQLPAWTEILVRTRDTRSQVRLTPSERARNVSNAFTVTPDASRRLRGTHVILVDDVITTAATLNAAAAALAAGGVRILSYLSFGRAPDPGDRTDLDLNLDGQGDNA